MEGSLANCPVYLGESSNGFWPADPVSDMRRLRLQALGPVTASIVGASKETLTQPRLLSLLVYLVIARPRGHHSRDTLMALLWPEADEASGRQGLRNALHRLRTVVGDRAIVSKGESFVGVDPAFIDCDVIAFERAVEDKRWDDAVAAYTGELLHGFHVAGAPEFEQWLDGERRRLTGLAVQAATQAADVRQSAGDLPGAIAAAQRACSLEPDNERSFRRFLSLLVASGDRVAAHRAYDDFSRRLQADFGVTPSAETRAALQVPDTGSPQQLDTRSAGLAHDVSHSTVSDTGPAHAPPVPYRKRAIALTVSVVVMTASAAWFTLRPRPATPVAPVAVGAALPARWRTDTVLLERYLRGMALLSARQFAAARDSMFRLTRDAPFYAPAWAGFARATFRSAALEIPPRQAMPRAATAARRALALDSTLAVAHEVLAADAMWGAWNLDSARKLLDRALVMHPDDPELRNMLATWYRWRGQFDSSLALKVDNAHRDPLSTRATYQVAPSLFFAHRCEEAIAPYIRLPQEVKNIVGDHILYRSLVCAGRDAEAAEVLREQVLREGDSALAAAFRPGMTVAQRRAASERVFQKRLAQEFEHRRRGWRPPERAMVTYADRRHRDSTLLWLDSMFVERSMMLYVVPFDPLMDFLRDDPRFDAFLRRLPWLSTLDEGPRRLVDSLRLRVKR